MPSNAVVVIGLTSPDATVTINERIAWIRQDGTFEAVAFLVPGNNLIGVNATESEGNHETTELSVISLAPPTFHPPRLGLCGRWWH